MAKGNYPRPQRKFFAGFHTFGVDALRAFEVKWVERAENVAPGWYWTETAGRGEGWQGPFCSSREAFRDAKARGALDMRDHRAQH